MVRVICGGILDRFNDNDGSRQCFRNGVTDRNVTCCCSRLETPLPSSDVFPGRQKKTILTFSEPVYQFSPLQVKRDLGTWEKVINGNFPHKPDTYLVLRLTYVLVFLSVCHSERDCWCVRTTCQVQFPPTTAKRREWKYSFLFFPLTHNSTHAFGGCLRGNSHIGTATGDMTHRFERVFIAIDNLLLLNGHHPALIACHVWTTGPLQTVY